MNNAIDTQRIIQNMSEARDQAQAVLDNIVMAGLSMPRLVVLESAATDYQGAFLRILETKDGQTAFNFSGNIENTPRYTPRKAREVIKAYQGTDKAMRSRGLREAAEAQIYKYQDIIDNLEKMFS